MTAQFVTLAWFLGLAAVIAAFIGVGHLFVGLVRQIHNLQWRDHAIRTIAAEIEAEAAKRTRR